MLIDWFTVSAQAVNFLILVWLLQRFLYRPILKAIDTREQKINDRIQQAEVAKTEAQQAYAEFQQKNDALNRQREAILSQAHIEAENLRQKLTEEIRQESVALKSKWLESLKNQQSDINQHIADQVQQEVFAISRKLLTDLASVSIEEAIVRLFIKKLPELKQSFKATENQATVKSRFELSNDQKQALQLAIQDSFSNEIQVQFNLADELIAGIELTLGGYKLAWSIADYLASLEESYIDILQDIN